MAGRTSCLSVFGLAFDATEREVHVLFSGCPGYVRCVVVPSKREGQKPYAFVQFDTPDNAAYATEARHGTTWEEGGPAVSVEWAKRDIPEHFGARQDFRALPQERPQVGPNQGPPAKRPRYDNDSWNDYQQESWAGHAPGSKHPPPRHASNGEAEVPDDGPRTLHVGGLPPGIRQADLDAFLRANFGDCIIGSKLSSDGKGKGSGLGRAFVGFTSHPAAQEAQSLLQGFNWDGAVLHAEWARSEFKFGAGAGSKGAPPMQFERPGKGSSTQSSRAAEWPAERAAVGPPKWAVASPTHSQGYQQTGSGGGLKTLHFTNLPDISEDEFHEFIAGTFPDQVASARFKQANDGRPPVAWVLFVDDFVAAQVVNTHMSFDWHGMQVAVQFARSELDPSKARGAR